jgi:hypothetical protein
MELGPVEYIVVGFEGPRFKGEVLQELGKLSDAGIIRVLDLMAVYKDTEGNVAWLDVDQLDEEDQATLGFVGADTIELLNEEDGQLVIDDLPNDTAVALLVVEDLWAKDLASAIRGAGGMLLDSNRVPAEVVQAALDFAETP